MTIHDKRRLNHAEWHSREAALRRAIGDDELEDYHVAAAIESLSLIPGAKVGGLRTADDVTAAVLELRDAELCHG